MNQKQIRKEKKNSANKSILEGGFASFSAGIGERYVVPFALALNANNLQIGFLSSFVGLISSLGRLLSSKLLYTHSRKRIIVGAIFLQALMWILISSVGLLVYLDKLKTSYAIYGLLIFYTLYASFAALEGPAWFSYMGDIIEEKDRSKYFSKRNMVIGIIAMLTTFGASFFLDYSRSAGILIVGFLIFFAAAAFFRFCSGYVFSTMYEPKIEFSREHHFSFWQFLKKAPTNNVGKFVIFISLINIATHFAAPFFAVYMLVELGFSYLTFAILILSGGFFTVISTPLWGKISENYGNKALLTIGSLLIPIAPLLWLVSESPIVLILLPQFFGGLGWSAFNLASNNFLLDAVTPQRRGIIMSYSGILTGISIFIGSSMGGFFAQYAPFTLFGSNIFLTIFFLSFLGRLTIVLFMVPLIEEVKEYKQKISYTSLNAAYMLKNIPIMNLYRGFKINIYPQTLLKSKKQ